MLAPRGVEALHGICMPNHSRGRIRAVALHARGNQEDVPYRPYPHTDYPRQPFRRCDEFWSAEGQAMNGEDKGIEDDNTYHGKM